MSASNRFFVDTNIWIRAIVKGDHKYTRDCQAIIDLIETEKIVAIVSDSVIAEIVWTCMSFYKIPKGKVLDATSSILATVNLRILNDGDIRLALSIFDKWNVKFGDAMIASSDEIARGLISILSYDKDFDRLGVKRVEPRAVLKAFR